MDVQFQVGSTSETMEVTGEPPQLQTDKSDIAIQFNNTYVQDLPTLNRNFTQFELMSPGTQKLTGWSHANTENPQASQQIFVNGQHFSGTNYRAGRHRQPGSDPGHHRDQPEPGRRDRSQDRIAAV